VTIPLVKGDGAIYLEPWLTREALAEYLGCSVRWIDYRIAEHAGFPAHEIAGRLKFRASDVETWLEQHGHKRRVA
jgi:excisionase family DNA binding protein